jgi:hypothetical protein
MRGRQEAPNPEWCYGGYMRGPDVDRERSERKHTLREFLTLYNAGLPTEFPRATTALLLEYKSRHKDQFTDEEWSLDMHRKKVMDWLPSYQKSLKS